MRHVTRITRCVIKTFANKRTQEQYRKGHAKWFPSDVAARAVRKLDYVHLATRIEDLRVPPGNRLHALRGDREDKPLMRRPTHPGEMLREDFLPDFGLTASKLAAAIHVSRQSVNQLLRGRRSVSPEMALRLGKLFGNSPEFWLAVQRAVDLWDAEQAIGEDVAGIETLQVA